MDAPSRTIKSNRATDIIIVVEPIEGKHTLDSSGLVDNRLFTGENKLHAKVDGTGLWFLQYDAGILPQPLKQRFTNWNILYNSIADYFGKRHIRIKEVID